MLVAQSVPLFCKPQIALINDHRFDNTFVHATVPKKNVVLCRDSRIGCGTTDWGVPCKNQIFCNLEKRLRLALVSGRNRTIAPDQ
jgi:hypothetical protein